MRILFVAARPPWPTRRGDQARVAGWVGALEATHDVRVVALRPPGFEAAAWPAGVGGRSVRVGRIASAAAVLRHPGVPVQVALHEQRRFREAIAEQMREHRPDVAVFVLSRLGGAAREWARKLPVVVDFVDSLALNMRSKASVHRGPLAALWRWEARRMQRWEPEILRGVHRGAVVSSRDRLALLGGREELADRLEVVPFGVSLEDAEVRGPALPDPPSNGAVGDRPRSGRPVVLLAGNLGYFPTRDGAAWFAREVWPRIREKAPRVQWWLAGSRIPSFLGPLREDPAVRVLDEPADLGQIRRRAAVSVAPLKGGSGTPIKILEAMADGIPVVATEEAARGLEERSGGELAIADDPEAFAHHVLELLSRPAEAARQTARALDWLRRRHEIGVAARNLEGVLERAIRDHRDRG